MSVVDILRQCETRLEKDAGLLVNRELNTSLLSEINMTLFIKTGVLKSFQPRPRRLGAFEEEEEKESLRLLRENRMATPEDLLSWGDKERDYHCRHFAMVRFLVGRALWKMREDASTPPLSSSSLPKSVSRLLFWPGSDVDAVSTTVTIHIPCALWMIGNPVLMMPPSLNGAWAQRRLCAAEMSAMACACVAYMILGNVRVKSYTVIPSTFTGSASPVTTEAIDIEFVWLWKK